MLCVFVAPLTPPELRHISIQDFGTSLPVAVGGLDGFDDDFLQAQTLTYAPSVFQDAGNYTAPGDTSVTFWCRRLKKCVVQLSFDIADNTIASLHPLLYDYNMVESVGEDLIGATPLGALTPNRADANGKFMTHSLEFELNGANRVGLIIGTLAGTTPKVHIKMAGV